MKKHLLAALALTLALPAAAASVALQGMIGKSALLVIDGGAPRAVAPGQALHGVKVIATQGDEAIVEVDGERFTLRVGEAPGSVKPTAPTRGAKSSPSGSTKGGASSCPGTFTAAASDGDDERVRCWLDAGADPNERDQYDATPLMHAARYGHTGTARLLMERGADPNIATRRDGATALMIAAYRGHADMVRLLLATGADPNARNDDGKTPLALAQRGRDGSSNPDIVQMLRNAGAKE